MNDAIYNTNGREECIKKRSMLRKQINSTCLLLNPEDELNKYVLNYGKIVEEKSEKKYR